MALGGRRATLAALALTLLVALAGIRAVAVDRTSEPARPTGVPGGGQVAPTRTTARAQPDSSALGRLFAARRQAVLRQDRTAWLTTIDPRSVAFRARQAAVFDNLTAVPFADWTYQVLDDQPKPPAGRGYRSTDPTRLVRVSAGYRVRGFDGAPSTVEQVFTVVQRSGRWFLSAEDDRDSAEQPWDFGPVRVVRGDHVLVLGTAGTDALRRFAEQGDRAVTRVSSVWGNRWPERAVLVVPRTQAEFGRLLDRPTNGLGQVAAVTTGDLGGPERPVAAAGAVGNDRIVLNPVAFNRLAPLGQRVVITHEMTHVAVRQSTAQPVPIWFSEGFADYLAYLDAGVSPQVAAGDLLALVRRGEGPKKLPGEADFDPTKTAIAPAYSGAWLACLSIAESEGQAGLVALYRRAAGGPGQDVRTTPAQALEAAFRAELGTGVAAFTRRWRGYLRDLAAGRTTGGG